MFVLIYYNKIEGAGQPQNWNLGRGERKNIDFDENLYPCGFFYDIMKIIKRKIGFCFLMEERYEIMLILRFAFTDRQGCVTV